MRTSPSARRVLRYLSWSLLLLLTLFWLVFALLSGGEAGAFIWQNLPNALPWVLLLLVVIVAWRRPHLGGLLVVLLGLGSILFFHTWRAPQLFLILTLPILLLGSLLLYASGRQTAS